MTGFEYATKEFVSYLGSERGLAESTVSDYQRVIKRYVASLSRHGVHDIAAVLPADVHAALTDLGKRSASHHIKFLSAVRLFHGLALREGWAQEDPTEHVESPRRPVSLPRPLRVEQATAIVESANAASPTGLRDRAVLELLWASGLRTSEVAGLNVDDCDLEARTVRCVGKGDKERVVPFGNPAAWALAVYAKGGRPALLRVPTDALFLNARGGRMSREWCWHIAKRYGASAKVEDVWPHRFRHSAATHMLGLGRNADLRVVQEFLGHARLQTTQVYTKVTPERLRWVIETCHPRTRGFRANGGTA